MFVGVPSQLQVLAERLGIRLLDLDVGSGGEGSEVCECPVISIDSYYLGLADATGAEIERYNFDDPAALDHDLLAHHRLRVVVALDSRDDLTLLVVERRS